jgi:hypothetical protein
MIDIEYQRSLFHRTHYELFYRTLPVLLRSDVLQEITAATKVGIGHQLLVGYWRATARQVCNISLIEPFPSEVEMTRDNFTAHAYIPRPGYTFLILTGPAPRGPLEAGCVVAVFEDARPTTTLRYFSCEAPMDSSGPWVVGEWFGQGNRANLGGIADVSSQGLCNFVAEVIGISSRPSHVLKRFVKRVRDEF